MTDQTPPAHVRTSPARFTLAGALAHAATEQRAAAALLTQAGRWSREAAILARLADRPDLADDQARTAAVITASDQAAECARRALTILANARADLERAAGTSLAPTP